CDVVDAEANPCQRSGDGLLELRNCTFGRLVERDGTRGAQDLAECPESDAMAGAQAAPSQDEQAIEALCGLADRFAQQATLADSGRTCDQNKSRARSFDRLVEQADDSRQLAVAADH